MKLELKHIIPYLPYRIKVQYKGIINSKELSAYKKTEPKNNMQSKEEIIEYDKWVNNYPKEIIGDKISEIKQIKFLKNYTTIHLGKFPGHLKTCFCVDIKLILHPLSDLRDNKDFIRKFGGDNPNNLRMCNLDIDDLINNGLEFESYYGYYEWLIENHFDVFRLIENNLAIDINTLENEK